MNEESTIDDAGTDLDDFRSAKNISLATRRRDGTWIASPVWFAIVAGRIYVVTVDGSPKTRRIMADAAVRVSPCTRVRGRRLGEERAATARIVPLDALPHAHRAVNDRYGFQSRVFQWQNRRKNVPMTLIEITITS